MEKRYVTFIIMSLILVLAHQLIMATFFPPPPKPPEEVAAQQDPNAEKAAENQGDGEAAADTGDSGDAPGDGNLTDGGAPPDGTPPDGDAEPDAPKPIARQWATLGNYQSGKYVAYFSNRGGAVRCVEVVERKANGRLRYRDLVNKSGYLGFLGLAPSRSGGCRVQVVAPGTPAAEAGIKPGDIIKTVAETPIDEPSTMLAALKSTAPGSEVDVAVQTASGNKTLKVKLAERPLAVIHPEVDIDGELMGHPGSFLFSLKSIRSMGDSLVRGRSDEAELPNLRSTRSNNWELSADDKEVKFTWRYTAAELAKIDVDGALEVTKTFRFPAELKPNEYHLDFELELTNVGEKPLDVTYRLDGPNGLPTEGWWYLYKVHPSWGTGGARDVTWRTTGVGYDLRSASQIWKQERNNEKSPTEPAFVENETASRRELHYAGVDTQYFHVAVLPVADDKTFSTREYSELTPFLINDANSIQKKHVRLGNVSFYLVSEQKTLEPNKPLKSPYAVFVGPKRSEVLSVYGLDETIVWGWFWWVAWPLSSLLHFFYMIVRNYGLAILLLTVLVRACVHPISRKAHQNAQMMQALAPETKKITEKYKEDPQKRMEAQQELYKKYNFNPLSGCLLAFAQFPIFIGLYRCLSVDIELRDAALIPGVSWCTNLAGPDMLYEWGPNAWPFLTDYTGWLGPTFNVLPLISVVLFIIQQQMFTPPPTDEQQAMSQKMMKGMTLFIGILFYKVAAGLCLYIIISSLWGVLERQLMPKRDLDQLRQQKAKQAAERPKRSADDVRKAETVVKRNKKKGKGR